MREAEVAAPTLDSLMLHPYYFYGLRQLAAKHRLSSAYDAAPWNPAAQVYARARTEVGYARGALHLREEMGRGIFVSSAPRESIEVQEARKCG
jgi:hypothetical protein